MTEPTLLTAARFERDRRAERYPRRIHDGAISADEASLDYQCWVAIAEWLESGRFQSIAGGANPDDPAAPIIGWPQLEAAAAAALGRINAKLDVLDERGSVGEGGPRSKERPTVGVDGPATRIAPETLGALRERRSCLFAIHRKVSLRRETIDILNAELRRPPSPSPLGNKKAAA
jgi:hypothetical protein